MSLSLASAGVAALTMFAPAAYAEGRYAAIVIDTSTDEVLHADAADELRYPASLTKMMTLYMLFDALEAGDIKLSDKMTVSRYASRQQPSKLGLKPGASIKVEDAIRALVTKSANDVAVVIAERLGGSESHFAAKMTAKARTLGMKSTTFVNASGLPNARQRTTARDMAVLGEALLADHPDYYRYFQTPGMTWGKRYARNHNRLLGAVEGVDGIKTGFTNASGYNLASSVIRDGRRLIAVVLGGETAAARDAQVAHLIEDAYALLGQRGTVMASSSTSTATLTTLPVLRASADLETGETLVEEGSADEMQYVAPLPAATTAGVIPTPAPVVSAPAPAPTAGLF